MQTAALRPEATLVVGPISASNAALRALRRRWFEAQGKEESAFPDALRWNGASLGGRLLAVLGYLDQDIPGPQRWLYEFYRAPGMDVDAIVATRTLLGEMLADMKGKRKVIATLPPPGENRILERYLTKIGARCGAQVWGFPE